MRTTSPALSPRSATDGREVGDQRHLAVGRAAEHDRGLAEALAQLVGCGEERLRVLDLDDLGDHPHAADLLGAALERIDLSADVGLLPLGLLGRLLRACAPR